VAPPTFDFDDVSLERLRARRSAKWRRYPPDVLPAWVAEMDFPLAPAVRTALEEALAADDAGYAFAEELPAAFARFAQRRFGWTVDPARVLVVADIMSGVAELLAAAVGRGAAVVVNPPVYPPFFTVARAVGCEVVEAPLGDGWRLDLDRLEAAFAAGAGAYLLCHPHNPTGTVHTREELAAVAALARAHGVLVLADEVHAPMTLAGATHVPYLTIDEDALALVSASKAWNVPGLKCALAVAASDAGSAHLAKLPAHVPFHAGHYGVLSALAAFDKGEAWLDALAAHLARQHERLAGLLAEQLPEVTAAPAQAGYLAWLDCRVLGLGADPSETFLERGRVALSPGPTFGREGDGFARLNLGTSGELLAEAVRRLARAVR